MLADFTIHIHELRKPMAVRVKVHNSTAALRGAIAQYDRRSGIELPEDHAETLGVCHRFHMANDPVVALVRLAPPHIGIGVLSHEMGHAAVWIHEIENKFQDKGIVCENDELFCWILGELVRQATTFLWGKGVYK